MKKLIVLLILTMSLIANDIIVKESSCSVDITVKNIKNILKAKNLSTFAIINHHINAKSVDMKLNESKVIIFGNPKLGSGLMQQNMKVGLDLPMRILVYMDTDSKVKMAYRNGTWLESKHILRTSQKIKKMNRAMDKITRKAGTCIKE